MTTSVTVKRAITLPVAGSQEPFRVAHFVDAITKLDTWSGLVDDKILAVEKRTAQVNSDAARDALFPVPVAGDRVLRTDKGWTEQYFVAPQVTTSGWFPVEGILPHIVLGLSSGTASSGGANAAVAWNAEVKDLLAWHDNATNPSRINVAQTGLYEVTRTLEPQSVAAGGFASADLRVNGVLQAGTARAVPNSSVTNASEHSTHKLRIAAGQYLEVFASAATAVTWHTTNTTLQLRYLGPA